MYEKNKIKKKVNIMKQTIGGYLKQARQDKGLTQKQLGDILGIEYYNVISQIELDRMSLPPAHWLNIAKALELNEAEFLVRCLNEVMPEVRKAVFGDVSDTDLVSLLTKIWII